MDLVPLLADSEAKILFVIADGLGGIDSEGRGTELEAARTPNLDRLASQGTTGLTYPVAPGITPGSGPGHLALFGYDPVEHNIGRGVLTALGIDFDLEPGDVAARGNFCTVDNNGEVIDRRAGRIDSRECTRLVKMLREIRLDDVEVYVEPVKEHRFLLVLRSKKEVMGAGVDDTDPHRTGTPPREPRAREEKSQKTAHAVNAFVTQARDILAEEQQANMVLLRGFAQLPDLASLRDNYGLNGCALAGYPMYRGIARLLGMKVADCGPDLDTEIDALQAAWPEHDFLFLHFKDTDSRGEDGDFDGKVAAIEELDRAIPRMMELQPDVIVVTGDHSTPSAMAGHSWHPVPVLIRANTCRVDSVEVFGETACAGGGLGHLPAKHLITLALAHAGRLKKYGA
ncbi:2,3-bisphosphoglycerate-independent phosphoglycerate mutase [Marinobacter orientalis]|uniref:2,3-bisphosphoglycerate-independent phosphoglycerate mutase n=1 Tax=Marinobacter orientalis TaxID=1928859 RepID=A0A7Y0RCU3_9GAMM|nr:2,3-bisphosphoglycerate-independent phosphoglycerate mutase [Marinobacter orientalis]NMT63892.1 2,3-bisphosphoglycerate-independent phosphoglycerate mutase [Marinobacter orientalis]TGX49992.1 2,3-bisphosphoglycerate-independent phosphoglycerate mutase [Marinobacter orientalis]